MIAKAESPTFCQRNSTGLRGASVSVWSRGERLLLRFNFRERVERNGLIDAFQGNLAMVVCQVKNPARTRHVMITIVKLLPATFTRFRRHGRGERQYCSTIDGA